VYRHIETEINGVSMKDEANAMNDKFRRGEL